MERAEQLEATLRKVLDLPEMYIVSPLTERFKEEIRALLKQCDHDKAQKAIDRAA